MKHLSCKLRDKKCIIFEPTRIIQVNPFCVCKSVPKTRKASNYLFIMHVKINDVLLSLKKHSEI